MNVCESAEGSASHYWWWNEWMPQSQFRTKPSSGSKQPMESRSTQRSMSVCCYERYAVGDVIMTRFTVSVRTRTNEQGPRSNQQTMHSSYLGGAGLLGGICARRDQ